MLDLLWRTAFRWKVKPHHVTGDGKYGTVENIRVRRPSQSLHADRALPEGDKETYGVDRAAVCGGQALARDAPVPDENPGEGQHRSPDDSRRAEYEAAVDLWRSWTEEAGPRRSSAVPAASSGSHRANCFEVPQSTTSALRESFFNTLGPF